MKFLASLFLLSNAAIAAEKPQYDAGAKVPDLELRDLQTDRPDKTESPFTVDAGHFQFETDLLNMTIDEDDGVTTRATTAGATNLRFGLTQNSDLHVIVQPYTDVRVGDNNLNSGVGDTTLRYKYNFFGNDAGDRALAVLPYVIFPTAEEGLGAEAFEGGLLLPFAMKLSEYLDLSMMLGWDKISVSDSKYVDGALGSVSLGYSISDDLGTYAEVYAHQVLMKHEPTDLTFDIGVTYQAERYQVDAGVNIGLSDAADDYNPFIGFAGKI